MDMKKGKLIRSFLFVVIGCVLIWIVSRPFGVSNSYSEHAEMMLNGYYEEAENTVDVVLIGNSHVYRYWQSAFAWEEHGISSLPISTSDMPYGAMKNVTIEALKTQDPDVLVLDATVFANVDDEINNKIYLLLDNMKYSRNYLDLIKNFCDFSGVEGFDRLQYYFPMIQFHSRWTDLSEMDFNQTQVSYLNSCYQKKFLTGTITDGEHIDTELRVELPPRTEAALRDLLEWCRGQDREILFYAAPILKGENQLGRINSIGDIIEEYGMKFIDFNDMHLYEKFGFDETTDFQDVNHTNVKGSLIFTRVFGEYLIQEYGLEDHRDDADYASWTERTQAYYEVVGEYLTDGQE